MAMWSLLLMMPCAASISAGAKLPAKSACLRRVAKNTLEKGFAVALIGEFHAVDVEQVDTYTGNRLGEVWSHDIHI